MSDPSVVGRAFQVQKVAEVFVHLEDDVLNQVHILWHKHAQTVHRSGKHHLSWISYCPFFASTVSSQKDSERSAREARVLVCRRRIFANRVIRLWVEDGRISLFCRFPFSF